MSKIIEQEKFVDFSKVKQSIPMPNLIQVQKKSYDDFLQMDLLPEERELKGLEAVFKSVFPFSNFKETCSIDFVKYSIGEWECKCGTLKGLEYMRHICPYPDCPSHSLGRKIKIQKQEIMNVLCPWCGRSSKYEPKPCPECGYPVDLQLTYTPEECIERGLSYAAPLRVTFRLTTYEDGGKGEKKQKEIKEEEVYFGEIPLMTETGTFIFNGIERVIVSQLHRSPGVFFTREAPHYYVAKISPYRGSWVEFEYDKKGILYVRIDRRKKMLGTIFLRSLGLATNEDILRRFYIPIKAQLKEEGVTLTFDRKVLEVENIREKERAISGQAQTKKIFAGIRWDQQIKQELEKKGTVSKFVKFSSLTDARFISDMVDLSTGEVLFEANNPIPQNFAKVLEEHNIKEFEIFFPQWDIATDVISNTIEKDPFETQEEAIMDFYKRLRPGEVVLLDVSKQFFRSMFFDEKRYDFSRVGRFKFNNKLSVSTDINKKTLSPEDFFKVVEYLIRLRKDIGIVDDIDNLGNRRVRSVGELLENHFRIGLVRMEKAIKEKMTIQELDKSMPKDLVNAKPVLAAIKEFFGTSQLSQFMDQTNPLAEITHKRRLSALGPGGLSRERAGFEVRDVHATHYSRICPVETPEGPNIGLISSLATYARVNDYGFIESPYRKVEKGRVLNHFKVLAPQDSQFKKNDILSEDELLKEVKKLQSKGKKPPIVEPYVFYLSASEEENYIIAQANVSLDLKGNILTDQVIARYKGEFITIDKMKVDFIDVSPKQVVSVAAALIPFLEHDDANRALMGSNMQRQAVPLLAPETPIVQTGMEEMVARDSGSVVICRRSGVVEAVDAERIIIRVEGEDPLTGEIRDFDADIYQLVKFKRSNQNTCLNQRPRVVKGQRVMAGEVIADGPSTEGGVLSQGRNVLVAFMPYRGYNFEDAIVISEKLVKEDAFTSIHIEEFECEARDTKLGPEQITCDIPNVGENALRNLDESGIIRIGSHVKTDDILVGKVTPKGETQLTPEEKLLRAIFGEKAGDYRDASLRVPPGIEGVVVNVRIFYRKGVEKDERARIIEEEFQRKLERNLRDKEQILIEERNKKIYSLVKNLKATKSILEEGKKVLLEKGQKFDLNSIKKMGKKNLEDLPVADVEIKKEVQNIVKRTESKIDVLKKEVKEKVENLHKGEELSPGVIKKVKVYIAMKRKLSIGDKMAGRHGNKGVISTIMPEEDMPFLPDGTPVEIVLNPLGVPSRMNVGQILETHLGYAGKVLGLKFITPVFEGAKEKDVKEYLKKAKLPLESKSILFDGTTGEPFHYPVTIGYIYMMKLVHMVDDKIHARSIGPYSLITQQPLGGKAQFGGQRFGEMEVWALEAYGAAYTLQELLTYKSDDVEGRTKIYQSIVKGAVPQDPGIPESFNVLVRELRSLCLNVELLKF